MDGVLKFRVGVEEPAEYVSINCAQLVLWTDPCLPKAEPKVRKRSRLDVSDVVKSKRKSIEQLCSQLVSNTPSDVLPCVTPSTSRKANECTTAESKKPQKPKVERRSITISGKRHEYVAQPCPHCNGRRVRVVNPGRMDGRNIMECTNSNCLATIRFTKLPAGTLINPGGTPEAFSWYDLDPGEIFYPNAITIRRLEESLKSATKKRFTPEIGYDAEGSVVVRCPGQREPVKLL